MSRYQHGYSLPSLASPRYRPLLSADPQGYIPYRHRADVYRFELDVLSLLIHVKGAQEYITHELAPTFPVVSPVSGSSNFDSFRDGWSVTVYIYIYIIVHELISKFFWNEWIFF